MSRRPRILHLLNSRHFNGAERVVANIISGLSPDYEGLFVSRAGPVAEVLAAKQIPFRAVPSLRSGAVRQIAREFRADLIHAHDYRASLIAATVGVPAVSHLHNNYPWASRIGPVSLAYRMALPKFRRVIAVSRCIVQEHWSRATLEAKTTVIGNGLDFEAIRRQSLPSASPTDLLFIGRFTEQKDPLAFVRVVRALQPRVKSLTAAMLGSGELLAECKAELRRHGLGDVVRIHGYCMNPYPVIASARICVMPSRWEGFGLVALEALTLGAAVIGKPVGGLADILSEVSPDLLCRTQEDLVDAAQWLLADESRRCALVARGRDIAEANYSLPVFLGKIAGVYAEVLD